MPERLDADPARADEREAYPSVGCRLRADDAGEPGRVVLDARDERERRLRRGVDVELLAEPDHAERVAAGRRMAALLPACRGRPGQMARDAGGRPSADAGRRALGGWPGDGGRSAGEAARTAPRGRPAAASP